MRRLFLVLIVLLVLVGGVGFYRGWFALTSPPAEQGTKQTNVNLTVDEGKIQEDAEALKDKAQELSESVTGSDKSPDAPAATDDVKSNDP